MELDRALEDAEIAHGRRLETIDLEEKRKAEEREIEHEPEARRYRGYAARTAQGGSGDSPHSDAIKTIGDTARIAQEQAETAHSDALEENRATFIAAQEDADAAHTDAVAELTIPSADWMRKQRRQNIRRESQEIIQQRVAGRTTGFEGDARTTERNNGGTLTSRLTGYFGDGSRREDRQGIIVNKNTKIVASLERQHGAALVETIVRQYGARVSAALRKALRRAGDAAAEVEAAAAAAARPPPHPGTQQARRHRLPGPAFRGGFQ